MATERESTPHTVLRRALILVGRAVRYELGCWRSLARWVSGRFDIPTGATGFSYRAPLIGPYLLITGVSVVEVVAFELILSPGWIRTTLFVFGIWGVLFMLGMLASMIVRPHLVSPAGLRIRMGNGFDLTVPWEVVADIRPVLRSHTGRSVTVENEVLQLVVIGQTTVDLILNRPIVVHLSTDVAVHRTAEITAVRFHADDRAGLVTAARSHLSGVITQG